MMTPDGDYPLWRQHVGVEKLALQSAIAITTFLAGCAFFIASFTWVPRDLATIFAPMVFASLSWIFTWVAALALDSRAARNFKNLQVETDGYEGKRIRIRVGRIRLVSPWVLFILFLTSLPIGLIGAALDDGWSRYGGFVAITVPLFALVLPFILRTVLSASAVTVEISNSGITWRWHEGWLRRRPHLFVLGWDSISDFRVDYRPSAKKILRGAVILIDVPGGVPWAGSKAVLSRAMLAANGPVLEFKLQAFPVNFNAVCSLMAAFLDSNRTGVPVTTGTLQELTRVPPLRMQRQLSR